LSKIKTDLVELFLAVANEKLDEITLKLMREVQQRLWWCQVDTLKSMKRKSDFWTNYGFYCFHAGTKLQNRTVVSNGGLAITSYNNDFQEVKNLIKI
jgi:phosphoribosylamine--glycine ligase